MFNMVTGRYVGRPSPMVRSLGLSRRLRALSRMGWSLRTLSVELGIKRSTLGTLARDERTMVHDEIAAKILARYDELSATPGPSKRAAMAALTKGWAHPDEWIDVDIDDPRAVPHPCAPVLDEVVVERLLVGLMPVDAAPDLERLAAVEALFVAGHGEARIRHELGMSLPQVRKDLYRLRRLAGESREEARLVRRAG